MGRVTNLGMIELNRDRRTSSIYVESTVGVGKLRKRRQKVFGQIPNINRETKMLFYVMASGTPDFHVLQKPQPRAHSIIESSLLTLIVVPFVADA